METSKTPLKQVKDALGGNRGIAAALGDLTPQAVSQWKQIPPTRVLALEELTGIDRTVLRPDVFKLASTQDAA